ncbi:MAG: insulinase family protein [Moheibacter sp.]
MKKLVYIFFMALIASGANAQVDRSQQPKPGPSPKVNVGKPQSFELKNGLKIMVVENHKLPRVIMSLSIDNPPFTEGNKKGVDNLTGSLIGNGTSKISKDAFQEEIDFMGSHIDFRSSGAYANTLSRYFSRTLELMAQGATDPSFTQEDFDKEVSRLIDGLKTEEKSVASNARRVENVLVYGKNHPNGEFVTEEKVKGLKLSDIKSHYKSHFIPNNAYLIVLGDVKFDEVKKLVEKSFSSWKKGTIVASKYAEPQNVSKTEIDFVDMPNAVQSEVSLLSSVNLKMTDKDYFAVLVANQLFGGDFNSYLNMNLREAHGWTYGARSSIRGSKYTGKFKAGASVRNEVTDSAVVESMKELNRIRTEKVTDEALATVKASFIGNFVMDAEKPEVIARQALLTQTQGLPANFYQNYIQSINTVTTADVMRVAKKYFSYGNARILVVGKASEVLPALEKLPYTVNYFDRFGNSVAKPEAKKVDANVTVQSIFDNYIQAVGGDKTKSVKTVTANYEGTVQGMKLTIKSINTTDGKYLSEASMMGQVMMKSVFDGKSGYNMQQGQKMDLDADAIADYKYDALPFPELTLGKKEGVKLAGIEDFNGSDAYVVVDGKKKYFYDVASGLKAGSATEMEANGQKMVQTVLFGDYQEFDGVKVPGQITMNMGMEIILNLVDAKINETIADSVFQ